MVAIKMGMPENCNICPFHDWEYYVCLTPGNGNQDEDVMNYNTTRHPNCPLIDMDQYIKEENHMNRKGANLFETLNKRADYAINSKSRSLVYQTYGECLMASELGAITTNEFTALNTRLVRNTINDKCWKDFHC